MSEQKRWRTGQVAWGLFLLVFLGILPLRLLAHAQLLRSVPANHAALHDPPAKIEVWFNELIEERFLSVNVFLAAQPQGTSKTNLVEGKPQLDASDRTHLTARLKPVAAGEYVVEWRVLSRDGHSAPGRFTFRVLPAK